MWVTNLKKRTNLLRQVCICLDCRSWWRVQQREVFEGFAGFGSNPKLLEQTGDHWSCDRYSTTAGSLCTSFTAYLMLKISVGRTPVRISASSTCLWIRATKLGVTGFSLDQEGLLPLFETQCCTAAVVCAPHPFYPTPSIINSALTTMIRDLWG